MWEHIFTHRTPDIIKSVSLDQLILPDKPGILHGFVIEQIGRT